MIVDRAATSQQSEMMGKASCNFNFFSSIVIGGIVGLLVTAFFLRKGIRSYLISKCISENGESISCPLNESVYISIAGLSLGLTVGGLIYSRWKKH